MGYKRLITLPFLILFFHSVGQVSENIWTIGNPVFLSGEKDTFDEIAVKDPSIVFFNDNWHLFYTARGNNEYTTAYVSAKNLNDLNDAPRHELKQIRGVSRYGCAPQVFYFEPQKLWYLIYQNRDKNYQPVFSTNQEISNPGNWTKYQNLIAKDSKKKWIDFWVIADQEKVYLFYTEAHNGVMVRSTKMEEFPNGWGESKKVYDDVHEAVHVYKVAGEKEFHMIYELNLDGIRSFGLATANHLEGPWVKITDDYATAEQLKWKNNSTPWTEMVSHGEAIRCGYDQFMEYKGNNCKWLIQGVMKNEINRDYPSLPWSLGIMEQVYLAK